MSATPGRIVLYSLSIYDALAINQRRLDARTSGLFRAKSGAQAHVGSFARAGDVLPMIVVRAESDAVNGQVFLDGNDTLWVASVTEGEDPGTWAWPPRVTA